MQRDRKPLGQDPRYAPFLYAAVGDDARGSSVTVLSMLARLGFDPWREASDLAAMPAAAARRRLSAVMARFTDVPAAMRPRVDLVARLLAFLPREDAPPDPDASAAATTTTAPAAGPAMYWIVALLVALALAAALDNAG